MAVRFLIFSSIIYGSLLVGVVVKKLAPDFSSIQKPATKILFMFFTGFITFNSLWSLQLRSLAYVILPGINLALILLSLIPAYLLAKVLSLTRSEKGSFLACALFSNWGVTLGGFICFLLYGKEGLYLSSWYIAFCRFYHYFIGLPILSLYTDRRRNGLLQTIGGSLSNPLWYVPLIFMISGLLLNLSGVGRPHAVDYLTTKWLVFITAAGYSFTIGLGAHFKESVKYVKLALFAALIKFFYNPLAAYAVLLFLGYFKRADFLPAHVVMTESFMPTAIISVVMVNLLDLNEDTANAIWFFTTIVVIPVVFSLMFIYGSK